MLNVGGRKTKPKAIYTLTIMQKKEVRKWLSLIQLPDGFASNIVGCARNMNFRCGTFVVKHRYYMDAIEYNTAHVYILCNTPEVQEYLQMYHDFLEEMVPESSD
ncbi:hypothetical protein LIER_25485 [Lithospermum erythrorhizon]|uniref:Uncharacterized protein n=1 Tax=Lithospermum erythrorhizon TaxID=34254 RepID=A0AAV3R562_LITER